MRKPHTAVRHTAPSGHCGEASAGAEIPVRLTLSDLLWLLQTPALGQQPPLAKASLEALICSGWGGGNASVMGRWSRERSWYTGGQISSMRPRRAVSSRHDPLSLTEHEGQTPCPRWRCPSSKASRKCCLTRCRNGGYLTGPGAPTAVRPASVPPWVTLEDRRHPLPTPPKRCVHVPEPV